MIYLLFILFISLYYQGRKGGFNSSKSLIKYSLPIILLWVVIVGGQYNVGTDYFSYIRYFTVINLDYFIDRGDILFAYFIQACHYFGMYGQSIFVVLSVIWILLLLPIFRRLLDGQSNHIALFFFVFIAYSTAFNNQMNGLRQYTSIYLLTYAFCLFMEKQYKFAIPMAILAVLNHKSSLIIILILLLLRFFYVRYEKRYLLYYIILAGFGLSILLDVARIGPIIAFLQERGLFDDYTLYYNYVEGGGDFMEKVTKYIYIPIYLFAIKKVPLMKLTHEQYRWFSICSITYSLKLAILSLPYIYRLGSYFEILMCVPIVYLMILMKRKTPLYFLLLVFYLLAPYFLKVTYFATMEYTYDSIFLH